MTFFYDPFLGGFGGGGTSQEIAELKASVFYRDGSVSMTGNADFGNYAILNLEYISFNDVAIAPGPGIGEVKLYSKVTGLPPPDPPNALFYKSGDGTEVEILHGGSGAGDVLYSGAATNPGAGILAVYDTIGTKITDSFVQIPPAVPVPTPGQVLTVVAAGPPVTTSWGAAGGAAVTSVSTTATTVNGVTLTATPNPIIGVGSISLGGSVSIDDANWSGTDLSVGNGGTGESTEQAAINALSSVGSASISQVLTKVGVNAEWADPSGGDVTGPVGATDNALARYDLATGKIIKNSIAILTDLGELSGIQELDVEDIINSSTGVVKIDADAQVTGNLVVDGTTTTTHSENVYANANYFHANTDYSGTTAQTGGLTIRTQRSPASVSFIISGIGFVAGVPGVSNPEVRTISTGIPSTYFSAGDLLGISGAPNPSNNGLYECLSHAAGTDLIVKGVGLTACVEDFTNNQFVTALSSGSGEVYQVNVSIMRSDTSGDWEVGKGDSTPIVYSSVGGGDVKSNSIPAVDSRIVLYDTASGTNIRESSVIIDETTPGNTRWKDTAGRSLFSPSMGVPFIPGGPITNCYFGLDSGTGATLSNLNFNNTAIGYNSNAAPDGGWATTSNTAVGASSLQDCTGSHNTACGASSLRDLNSTLATDGNRNCAFGASSLDQLGSGANDNIAIGYSAGDVYSSNESNNIVIGSNLSGVVGESNTTRLGINQTRCFIEGIVGNASTSSYENVLINPVDGQLATDTYAYGEQYIQGNTANDTSLSVGVWGLLNGIGRVNGPSNDFLQNVGYSMTYTGTPDILAKVNVSVTWENDSTSNIKVQLGVFLNANPLPEPNLRCRAHLDDGTDYPRNCTLSGFVNLSNGDTLSVQCLNETDSDDIIFWSTNFNINKIALA